MVRSKMESMSTKSREVIWGGQIMGGRCAPKWPATKPKAVRAADLAEAEAWSVRMGR